MRAKILYFIFLGILLVAFIAGLILLSYLLIFGAIVGLILFAIAWIREKFFPTKHMTIHQKSKPPGRTFDHDK